MHLISVIAIILNLAGNSGHIDKGLADGLRYGDEGIVFYTMKVGSGVRRIDVGRAEVVAVDDFSARIKLLQDTTGKANYSIEFRLPDSRNEPQEVIRLARLRLDEQKPEIVLRYIAKIDNLPLDNSEREEVTNLRAKAQAIIDKARRAQEEQDLAARRARELEREIANNKAEIPRLLAEHNIDGAAALIDRVLAVRPKDKESLEWKEQVALHRKHQAMARMDPGIFTIGLDLEAGFYNERPKFKARLGGFYIDPQPTGKTGLTYQEAEAHCKALGKRLPTEFEWEAAALSGQIKGQEGIEEWTASWYAPYPGNIVWEDQYGEKFKVLRGFPHVHKRRFMDPTSKTSEVTFRCACE